jgi:hypothetical protein
MNFNMPRAISVQQYLLQELFLVVFYFFKVGVNNIVFAF